jgi:hypothetical protein
MKTENKFCLFNKSSVSDITYGYTYDEITGELHTGMRYNSAMIKSRVYNKHINIEVVGINAVRKAVIVWDKNDNVIASFNTVTLDFDLPDDAYYFAINFYGTYTPISAEGKIKSGNWVIPYYKQLKKTYKKESGQMFFRESLDGQISLFRDDYDIVKQASLEENLYLYVYRNNNVYASASFNKTDCKFDHFRKKVELKLTFNDKYSKVLNAYENTYDLVKLSPALTPITLTKRCVVQIYIQGERTLSNYAGGTYWETEVDEIVDDENALLRKYYFSKGPKYVEVDLQGFNFDINAAYRRVPSSDIWNATFKKEVDGVIQVIPCSIKFTKVINAGTTVYQQPSPVALLSTGSGNGISETEFPADSGEYTYRYIYDTYRIEIYTGKDASGDKIYESSMLYGKDADFTLSTGNSLYPMVAVSQTPMPTPNTFSLGAFVVEYQVWGRLLCDTDTVQSHEQGHEGELIPTYDLPRDDFATPRRNYRKCIGLRGFDSQNSVIKIFQNDNAIDTPTAYGINDFGQYFVQPYTLYGQYFYPLARSSWANVSLWVMLGSEIGISPFEEFCAENYKEYTIKDTYHISDAIKVLLAKIDPRLSHDNTEEYSSFLYGHSGGSASALGNCDLYITQKTNILKGEYDQAAQKAEIKFKQLMDMLRDCFRCYWFIDDQNRFRIEHISYFMNGFSYDAPSVRIDLTKKLDKFNKKAALYCQQEIEYDKSNLTSRYEFAYMDDVTKAMGGDLYIDINNNYIKKDKVEEISISDFTADIDYMLFLPDDFSNDGFALILADENKKVPIINQRIRDEKQSNHIIDVYVQNWYASFNQLAWHYMYDISGNIISYNNINYLPVSGIKRSMKHTIDFPATDLYVDIYELIKSDIGNGYIEEVTVNIDTNLTEVELRYEPN